MLVSFQGAVVKHRLCWGFASEPYQVGGCTLLSARARQLSGFSCETQVMLVFRLRTLPCWRLLVLDCGSAAAFTHLERPLVLENLSLQDVPFHCMYGKKKIYTYIRSHFGSSCNRHIVGWGLGLSGWASCGCGGARAYTIRLSAQGIPGLPEKKLSFVVGSKS